LGAHKGREGDEQLKTYDRSENVLSGKKVSKWVGTGDN